LPVASLLPSLALDGEVVPLACLLEPPLLPLVALMLLPQLPGERLALRHLPPPHVRNPMLELSVGRESL